MGLATLRWTSCLRNHIVGSSNYQHVLMQKRFMSHVVKEISESDPPFPLIGPPEIYLCASPLNTNLHTAKKEFLDSVKNYRPESSTDSAEQESARKSDSFVDQTVINGIPAPNQYMGLTENNSPTLLSSGNPCLDFFFHVVPNTPVDSVTHRLQLAWEQNPLTALKLVYNLRGVRGTGKGDKESFYAAALWLHEKHPKTLACNAQSVARFGYFKDLLEILYRLQEGPDVRVNEKKEIEERKRTKGKEWYFGRTKTNTEERRIEAGRKAVDRYNTDPVYRFLHNQTSLVFAEAMKADLKNLKDGEKYISLAAKWCPSLYSIYDNATLLCESIGRRMFPKDMPEFESVEDAHYAYRVRYRLQKEVLKEVLVPLRKALKLPEIYMTSNRWSELPYNRVASIAMKNYEEVFKKHDLTRFIEYLGDVKTGKKKIAAGALLPHQIIASVKKGGYDENSVSELQWQRIVDDLSAIGKLKNCLAICDVSGSMAGIPLEVSVALGLLVSELSEEPWKGRLITFSENPQLQIIKGNTIREKIWSVEQMDWDFNTNFQRVFDKILEVAKKGNLSEEQMIKRLFVFSDMEFDQASSNPWETDYEAICRKFNENGYKSVPEIVFWNLRDSKATPVPSHQNGVALVSGFSKKILKLFLEEGGVLNPEITMELAIAGKEYKKLVVVD